MVTKPKVTTFLSLEEMEGVIDLLHDAAVDEPEYDDLYQYFHYETKSRDKIDLERMRESGAVEDYYGLLDVFIQKYFGDKRVDEKARKWLQKIAFKQWVLEDVGVKDISDLLVLDLLFKGHKNIAWYYEPESDASGIEDSDTDSVLYQNEEDLWNV